LKPAKNTFLKSWTARFFGIHTAEALQKELTEVMDKFKSRSKVVSIISDGASNIQKAMYFIILAWLIGGLKCHNLEPLLQLREKFAKNINLPDKV
jgi:hypothetical protein